MPLARKIKERWTYADYLTWPDDARWEIIDGVAYAMSPSPGKRHQEISGEIYRQMANYLKGKPCKIFSAPFDVRFADRSGLTDDKVETVVQPDILVVCDRSKLDERGCNGAPDLVIEILSQSTAAHDLKVKFELYQRYGVREYWLIHPFEQTLLVYRLSADGNYGAADRFAAGDSVPVPLMGDLVIDLGEVFLE